MSRENVIDYYIANHPERIQKCSICSSIVRKLTFSGGSETCGDACSKEARKRVNLGRKQTQETIKTRIENTDQTKKEQKRQQSLMSKYGTNFYCSNPKERAKKISESLSGKQHTKEHHANITQSKRKNGTLKHTKETKLKISKTLKEYWENDTLDHCVVMPKRGSGGGHKHGFYNGIYYRSSYELKFLEMCEKYNVQVESASTKEFRIRYFYDNKKRYYYPDFYLPEYDVVVEIKPMSMLDCDGNWEKITSGSRKYNFWLVTEEELEEPVFISEVNSFEHIFS